MTDHDYVASRHIVWRQNIPQTMLDVYFNYVRVLRTWKRSFPHYIYAAIRDVLELALCKTKIVTEAGDNLFLFEERNTLASAAAELVKTEGF